MQKNKFLVVAAICSGVAALLHLGCIIFGGEWYRFFGAGEQMAQLAEAGHIYPTIVTLVIVILLLVMPQTQVRLGEQIKQQSDMVQQDKQTTQ